MLSKFKNKNLIKGLMLLSAGLGLIVCSNAFADASTGIALSTIATNINKTVANLAVVLQDISLVAGIGFVLSSFFKFHQHKLNPTQVPISQGVTLLLIGAGLVIFPYLIPTAKKAVFGTAAISKTGGAAIKNIITSGGTGG